MYALIASVSPAVLEKTKERPRCLVVKAVWSAPGSQKTLKTKLVQTPLETPKPGVSLKESLTIKYFGGFFFCAFSSSCKNSDNDKPYSQFSQSVVQLGESKTQQQQNTKLVTFW